MNKAFAENPFRILEASPSDDRRSLIERADEASLLGEDNAPDALDALLNSQRRLDAEINWFPQTDKACVQAILAYPEAGCAPYPDVRTPSTLALFNACRVMLETWTLKTNAKAVALCKSLAAIDARMTAAGVIEQINADRKKAGMQLLASVGDVAYRLDQLRHETAKDLMERIQQEASASPAMNKLMEDLAIAYKDTPSQLLESLVGIYELNNAEKMASLQKDILAYAGVTVSRATLFNCQDTVRKIENLLNQWANVSAPVRRLQQSKGISGDESRKLFHDVREFAVKIQNELFMMNECYTLLRLLKSVFWNLPDAIVTVEKDISTLDQLKIRALARSFQRS